MQNRHRLQSDEPMDLFWIAGRMFMYITGEDPNFYITGNYCVPEELQHRNYVNIHKDPNPINLQEPDMDLVRRTIEHWETLKKKRFILPKDVGKYAPVLFQMDYSVDLSVFTIKEPVVWSKIKSDDIIISSKQVYPGHMNRLVREMEADPMLKIRPENIHYRMVG